MRLPVTMLLALIAMGMSGAAASAKPKVTKAEASATRQAFERGQLIYAYDRAAWQGSDELVKKLPDYASKVGGWIVDGPAAAPQLVFYDRDLATPHAVFIANFQGAKLASSQIVGAGGDSTLSPVRRAMIAARHAALEALDEANVTRCKEQPFNTVVLPPERTGGPTLVYVMTPQSSRKAIPIGGHYRIEVADGEAEKPQAIGESCLEMPFEASAGAALAVTHPLDPVPTEMHVFSSLAAGMPINVTTKDKRVWVVDGTGIKPLAGGKRR